MRLVGDFVYQGQEIVALNDLKDSHQGKMARVLKALFPQGIKETGPLAVYLKFEQFKPLTVLVNQQQVALSSTVEKSVKEILMAEKVSPLDVVMHVYPSQHAPHLGVSGEVQFDPKESIDRFFARLSAVEQLQALNLSGMVLQRGTLAKLEKFAPTLLSLSLQDCENVTTEVLDALPFLPALQVLNLSRTEAPYPLLDKCYPTHLTSLGLRVSEVRPDSLETIAACRHLKRLTLGFTDLNQIQFLVDCKELQELDLAYTFLTARDMLVLQKLDQLRDLNLDGTPFSERELACLVALQRLERLNLSSTRASDATTEELAQLPRLKEVHLSFSGVTSQGIERLKKRRPDLNVVWMPEHQASFVAR